MYFQKIIVLFAISFVLAQSTPLPVRVSASQSNSKKVYLQELPIVVLICSYNNAPWVEKNLASVFAQKYTNWRIVYFDDASTDGTPDLVRECLKKHSLEHACTLVTNKLRGRKLKNLYTAFHHYIEDEEIILQLDGDDWLAHENVFSLINELYQEYDIWMTYGNYQNVPDHIRQALIMDFIPEHIVENRLFREQLMFMHLRTFYGWLAKQIKVADLMSAYLSDFKSNFFPASNDAATIWPMFEMAWHHFAFIEEVLYCLNRSNPINGFKVDRRLQRRSAAELQIKMPVYMPIEQPRVDYLGQFKHSQADCIIFSHNNPDALQNLFDSLEKYTQDIQEIWLCYQADTQDIELEYRKILIDNVNNIHNFSITGTSINNNLQELLNKCQCKHLLLCTDSIHFRESTPINHCILELERTGAYGFYLTIGSDPHSIPDQHLWQDLYASKFNASKYAWFNSLDATLLRKKDFLEKLSNIPDTTSISDFIIEWTNNLYLDITNAGLYYSEQKVFSKSRHIRTQLPFLEALPNRRKTRCVPKTAQNNPDDVTSKSTKKRRLKKRSFNKNANFMN